jgi:predicted ArsR family transcriptional regulator
MRRLSDADGLCRSSQSRIAAEAGLNLRAVWSHIKDLTARGAIRQVERGSGTRPAVMRVMAPHAETRPQQDHEARIVALEETVAELVGERRRKIEARAKAYRKEQG